MAYGWFGWDCGFGVSFHYDEGKFFRLISWLSKNKNGRSGFIGLVFFYVFQSEIWAVLP